MTDMTSDDTTLRRRQFLRSLGVAGATAVGLSALDSAPAMAFTLKELEEKLRGVGESTYNISIGSEATPGSELDANIAIGAKALVNDKASKNNVALGAYALEQNTSGEENVAVGTAALRSNTTGFLNVAAGVEALYSNTTGGENTAVGWQALHSNTSGQGNTAVGHQALLYASKSSIGGNENTAVGLGALRNCENGDYNTAIGNNALHSAKETTENTALGVQALERLFKGGGKNTAIGAQSLEFITDGEHNTAVGWGAGQAVVGGKEGEEQPGGSGNVFIGFMAGRQELGSNKLYIANSETAEPLLFGEFPSAKLQINASQIGFFKHAPGSQGKVTGKKNTEVEKVLKTLLESLSGLGLVKDETT